MLATGDNKKSTPIYLHCEVSARVSDVIKEDFLTKKKFYLRTPKDAERDYESEPHYSNDLVKQMYDDQTRRFNKQNNVNNTAYKHKPIVFRVTQPVSSIKNDDKGFDSDIEDDDDDYDDNEDDQQHRVNLRSKRETRDSFTYEWLKNDNSILTFAYSMSNQPITNDKYTLYPNGTIKFIPSSLTTGVYRCKANFTYLDNQSKRGNKISNRNFEIGPILSHKTVVELTGNISKIILLFYFSILLLS